MARKRKTEEQAAVVSLKANGNVNDADPLRNREGDEQERTFIQTKSTCFAVSYRAEENGASRDSTLLTVSLDNQPLTSVSKREPMREPLENFMSIVAESTENDPATCFVDRSLFDDIVSSMQLFVRRKSRSSTSMCLQVRALFCGRGSSKSRAYFLFLNASRRDSEDRQTNAKGIPQQSAELSDHIPSVKIGSDGECTMKDTSCPVLTQVHTCDGDIATIIAKRVRNFTVQGVTKMRENTLRKN